MRSNPNSHDVDCFVPGTKTQAGNSSAAKQQTNLTHRILAYTTAFLSTTTAVVFPEVGLAQIVTPQRVDGSVLIIDEPLNISTTAFGAAGYTVSAINGGTITVTSNGNNLLAQNSSAVVAQSGGRIVMNGTGGAIDIASSNALAIAGAVWATGAGSTVDLTAVNINRTSTIMSPFSGVRADTGGALHISDSSIDIASDGMGSPTAVYVLGTGSVGELESIVINSVTAGSNSGGTGIYALNGGSVSGKDVTIEVVSGGNTGSRVGVLAEGSGTRIELDNLTINATVNSSARYPLVTAVTAQSRSELIINGGRISGDAIVAGLQSNINASLTANDVHVTSTRSVPLTLITATNSSTLTMNGGDARYSGAADSNVVSVYGRNSVVNLNGAAVTLGAGSNNATGANAVRALSGGVANLSNVNVLAQSGNMSRIFGLNGSSSATINLTNASTVSVRGGGTIGGIYGVSMSEQSKFVGADSLISVEKTSASGLPGGTGVWIGQLSEGRLSNMDIDVRGDLSVGVSSAAEGAFVDINAGSSIVVEGPNSTALELRNGATMTVTDSSAFAEGDGSSALLLHGTGTKVVTINNSNLISQEGPSIVVNEAGTAVSNISLIGKDTSAAGAGVWLSVGSGATANVAVLSSATVSGAVKTGVGGATTLAIESGGSWNVQGTSGLSMLSLNGGILRYHAADATINTSDPVNLVDGGGTIDTNGYDVSQPQAFSGSGGLGKSGDGIFTLDRSNVYAGPTTILQGTLRAGVADALSSLSDHSIANSAKLDLHGLGQTIASLNNAGSVLLGGSPGTILYLSGDYNGAGGTISFNTTLGDDEAATDGMIVAGNTSGSSLIAISNINGEGRQTVEGIRIIEVGGASEGRFTLQGNYVTKDGQAAVIGGAYAYTLHRNGISDPQDGNWYLRSTLQQDEDVPGNGEVEVPGNNGGDGEGSGNGGGAEVPSGEDGPRYSAGVPIYEVYPQVLKAMNGAPSLQQRVGNRYWREAPPSAEPVFCKDPAQNFRCAPTVEQSAVYLDGNGNYAVDQNGVWARVEGSHSRFRPDVTTSSANYDVDLFRMQAGVDGLFYDTDAGRLIGGFNVQYARAKADISSFFGDGENSTDGYGIGSTLTWYSNSGFYIDGQAQAMWYSSDLTSLADGITIPGIANGNHGFGYALSLESGKRVEFSDGWSVTPQAQLVYSSVDFDSFTDPYGADISLERGDALQGRLGLSLEKSARWTDGSGQVKRSHIYGIANIYNEFLDGSRVSVSGASFDSRNERLWGDLGLGGSYNWDNDKYSVYGEGSIKTSLTSFADSYSLKATIGFRTKW